MPTAATLGSSESARGKTDADFQWLVADIAAYEKLRAQKTLSLSLAKRKAERETADADQLRRENERRKAQGKPVFASLAEMETLRAGSAPLTTMTQAEMKALGTVTQAEMEALVAPAGTTKPVPADSKAAAAIAAEKEPDILLDSTTQIMGDIVAGITPTAAPRTAQRESNSGTTSAN